MEASWNLTLLVLLIFSGVLLLGILFCDVMKHLEKAEPKREYRIHCLITVVLTLLICVGTVISPSVIGTDVVIGVLITFIVVATLLNLKWFANHLMLATVGTGILVIDLFAYRESTTSSDLLSIGIIGVGLLATALFVWFNLKGDTKRTEPTPIDYYITGGLVLGLSLFPSLYYVDMARAVIMGSIGAIGIFVIVVFNLVCEEEYAYPEFYGLVDFKPLYPIVVVGVVFIVGGVNGVSYRNYMKDQTEEPVVVEVVATQEVTRSEIPVTLRKVIDDVLNDSKDTSIMIMSEHDNGYVLELTIRKLD